MKAIIFYIFITLTFSAIIFSQQPSKSPLNILQNNANTAEVFNTIDSNIQNNSTTIANYNSEKESNRQIQENEQKSYSNSLATLSLVLAGIGLMIALFAVTVSFWAIYANNKIKSLEEKDRRIDGEIKKLSKLENDYQKGIDKVKKSIDSTESKLIGLIDERTNRQLAISLVEEMISIGQFERAINKIESISINYIDDEELQKKLLMNQGNVYCHEKNGKRDVKKALRIFEECSSKYGNNYQILDYVGYCHLEICKENGDEVSRVRSAIECFKKIALDTELPRYEINRAKLNIASCHLMINEFKDALEIYLDLSQFKPLISEMDFKQVELGRCICWNEIDNEKINLHKEFDNTERFIEAINFALDNFIDEHVLILRLKESFEQYHSEKSSNGNKPN